MVTKQDLINDSNWIKLPSKIGSELQDPDGNDTFTITGIQTSKDGEVSADNVSKGGDSPDDIAVILEGKYGDLVVYENGDAFFRVDYDSPETKAIPAGETENEPLIYTAVNSEGETATGQEGANTVLSINITGYNDAPEAQDDNAITQENTSVDIDVLANDSDPDTGDSVTIIESSLPDETANGGKVKLNADGTVKYTPAKDFDGVDSFEYTVIDENGATAKATVTVKVENVNAPPKAKNDTFDIDEDTQGAVLDVLANDTDPDGDVLKIIGVDGAQHGAVAIVEGKLVYTPDANFNGKDTLTYRIEDPDGETSEAKVTINVLPKNDPVTAKDDIIRVKESEGAGDKDGNVLDNDEDGDNDALSVAGAGGAQPGQSFAVNGGGRATVKADGSVDFDANGDFEHLKEGETEEVTFTYTATDNNGASNVAKVTVIVEGENDAPVARKDFYTIDEDSPAKMFDVLENDSDPDGDALTLASVRGMKHGTAEIEDNKLVYKPDAGFHGKETLTYTVKDPSGAEAETTVTITVNSVNDGPDAQDDNATHTGDPIKINVLANDTDPDGDTLSVVEITGLPQYGTVKINDDFTVTYTPDDYTQAQRDDSFIYRVTDGNGGYDEAKVYIKDDSAVIVNCPPNAKNDYFRTHSNEGADNDKKDILILENDTDADGDTLEIIAIGGKPAAFDTWIKMAGGGSIRIQQDGRADFRADGDFDHVYQGETASTTISYTISDGNGGTDTADIRVEVCGTATKNNAPVAKNDYAKFGENENDNGADFLLLRNDRDPDGDTLKVTAINGNESVLNEWVQLEGGGRVRVTEDGKVDFRADDDFKHLGDCDIAKTTFTYTVSDGKGGFDTAKAVIKIIGESNGPVARDDHETFKETEGCDYYYDFNILDNDSSDYGGLRLTQINGESRATNQWIKLDDGGWIWVNSYGDVDFHASDDFAYLNSGETATTSFTYTVSDGKGKTDTATVKITVTGEGGGPEAQNDYATFHESEGSNYRDFNLLDNDTSETGTLKVTHIDGESGALNQWFHLEDGGKIWVKANGSVDFDADGDFDHLNNGETATTSFTYKVSDGNGGYDTAKTVITVKGESSGITAVDDFACFYESENNDREYTGQYDFNIIANDRHSGSGELKVTKINGQSVVNKQWVHLDKGGWVWVTENGDVDFAAWHDFKSLQYGDEAMTKFTYEVTDGKGNTDTATVDIKVQGTWHDNYSPVAFDIDGSGFIEVTGATTARDKDGNAKLGDTVEFDINYDGEIEVIEWLQGGKDALLVDNRDGMAAEDMHGGRLFGDEGGKYLHGYEKLSLLDGDADGFLKGNELTGLQLWLDDGDAQAEDGEMYDLADFDIVSVSTSMNLYTDGKGDILMRSSAETADGKEILTEDVWFAGKEKTKTAIEYAREDDHMPKHDDDGITPEDIHDWSS